MIRIILAFFVVFGMFYFGIEAVRHMTGREQWTLVKTVAYSLMCAVLTVATLAVIVLTF